MFARATGKYPGNAMKVVVVFASLQIFPQQILSLGDIGNVRTALDYLSPTAKSSLESFDYSQHDLYFCSHKFWNQNDLDPYSVYLLDPILKLETFPSNCYILDKQISSIQILKAPDDSQLHPFKLAMLFDKLEATLLSATQNFQEHGKDFSSSGDLNFNQALIGVSDDELLPITMTIFKHYHKELDNLYVSDHTLFRFLHLIKSLYHSNEYHNFYHAVDVLQCSHFIVSDPSLRAKLRDIDILAVLVSAICHDVGHLGVNNPFLTSYYTDLALLYNDSSPLENYHAFLANFVLEKIVACDFRKNWDRSLKREFRKLIIGSILATDMAHHNRYLSLFQSKELIYSDRCLLLGMILKAADLSNVVRPFRNSEKWSHCLRTEFYLQGNLEKKLGYRPPKFLDEGADVFPESQVYFMETFALPLFKTVISYFPTLKYMHDNLLKNIEEWRVKNK